MMDFDFRPVVAVLIIFGMLIVGVIWGTTALITHKSYYVVKTHKPLVLNPDIEISIKNGVSDTLYIYHIPKK